ncbi:unnamed protein product, partial [Rotaria sp. Silwood1]
DPCSVQPCLHGGQCLASFLTFIDCAHVRPVKVVGHKQTYDDPTT